MRPIADAMTTAASAVDGRFCRMFGATRSITAIATAPTTPVSWLFAPAASATGVREELLLMGNPWNRPAARLAAPRPTISWFGSTGVRIRAAYTRESTLVSAKDTRATATPPMSTGLRSSRPMIGKAKPGRPRRERPEHGHARGCGEIENANRDRRAHDRDENSRYTRPAFQKKNQRQRGRTDRQRDHVRAAGRHRPRKAPGLLQRTVGRHGETEQLGKLAQEHGQRDAVHVAVANRLREQFRDEPQTRQSGRDAHETRHDRHHAGQRDGTRGIAARERQDDGQNDRGE